MQERLLSTLSLRRRPPRRGLHVSYALCLERRARIAESRHVGPEHPGVSGKRQDVSVPASPGTAHLVEQHEQSALSLEAQTMEPAPRGVTWRVATAAICTPVSAGRARRQTS